MNNESELRPSDEVDKRHLEPARRAGDAYREAAEHMIEEVAETGAMTESGDYLVGFALEDGEGNAVGPTELPFLWHPGLYHYGRNLELPGDGTYAVTVEVDPPAWPRHDERNGDRFAASIEERFEDVERATGRD